MKGRFEAFSDGVFIVTHYVDAFDGGSLFLIRSASTAVRDGMKAIVISSMGSVMLSYSRWRGHLRSAYDREAPRALTRYAWVGAAINAIGIGAAFVSPLAALAVLVASSCYWGVVTSAWRPRGAA